MNDIKKRKIGIVGFGHLGEYLTKEIIENPKVNENFEIAFIWNRSKEKILKSDIISKISKDIVLNNLEEFIFKKVDLIIEVCHPNIITEYGEKFLEHADLLVGSPTAFFDKNTEIKLRNIANNNPNHHGCYIASGALWGVHDIERMASKGTLGSLKITMKKYPTSLKVESILMEKLKKYIEDSNQTNEFILYEGPVRDLCPLAPNNVNTIACAALAAHNLGFDGVYARLIADKNLKNAHIIDIEVTGPIKSNKEEMFQVHTTRYNPANPGEVTGAATYSSFLSSLLMAHSKGNGFHFC